MGSNRKGRDIDAAFRRKCFRRDMDGKHITYCFQTSDGRDTNFVTRMSHGMMGSSLDAKLIGDMARQLRLSKNQFLALIDCTMSADE